MVTEDPPRLPSQASLDALFGDTRRARITDVCVFEDENTILLEVEGADVAIVRYLLRIKDHTRSFHCSCDGDLAVELYGEAGLVATIGFHHGRSIRVPGWSSDAMLLDGPALLRWIAERGVRGPLDEYEKAAREGE